MKLAGGDGILVERLSAIDLPSSIIASTDADRPIEHLAKCAELVHTGAIESAEKECRASIEENPKSPWPLFVTAELLQPDSLEKTSPESGEGNKTERAELLRRAASLAPNPVFVHRALALILPASEAMSELQKASSLDPEQSSNSRISSSFIQQPSNPVVSSSSCTSNTRIANLQSASFNAPSRHPH